MFRNHATSTHQTYFMLPGSCQMEGIIALYNYIMLYLVGILFFVSAALVIIIHTHLDGSRHNNYFNIESRLDSIKWVRYLKSWTHSTPLELIWTILPTLILIAIAVPSFILLYSLDEIVDTQCVVKVIGYQWYWRYEYPITLSEDLDVTNVYYFSYMKSFSDLTEMWPKRLLEVDMPLILPNNVNIKIIVTAKDVLHSFAVPSLGIKMDAVPGRLNQITLFIFKPGIYYGQCSELCGVNHAFMPIVLHSVSFDIFQNFLNKILLLTQGEEILVNEIDNINPEGEDTGDSSLNDINPTNTNPNDSTSDNTDLSNKDREPDRPSQVQTKEDDSDIFYRPVSMNPYLNPNLDIDPFFQTILDNWDKKWNDCMEGVITNEDSEISFEKLRACMRFFRLADEETGVSIFNPNGSTPDDADLSGKDTGGSTSDDADLSGKDTGDSTFDNVDIVDEDTGDSSLNDINPTNTNPNDSTSDNTDLSNKDTGDSSLNDINPTNAKPSSNTSKYTNSKNEDSNATPSGDTSYLDDLNRRLEYFLPRYLISIVCFLIVSLFFPRSGGDIDDDDD